MKNIIDIKRLQKWQAENRVVVIDVRANLQDKTAGRQAYEIGHIPGAYHLDLEDDLSSEAGQHGGNHPLPDMQAFAQTLGACGVTKDKKVVVYDEANDMFAPRAWWLIKYAGHPETYVLNGGIAAWQNAGLDVTQAVPERQQANFTLDLQSDWTLSMTEVKNRGNKTLIDSRAHARYLGQVEPLYKKAGHIPGAKNFFWKDVLDQAGQWKTSEDLSEHFSSLDKTEPIIVSCGSGVSACPNIIALQEAGFENVKLYPGSYSDWISYEENEVETKEEA